MVEGWLLYHREDYGRNRAFADRLIAGAYRHGLSLGLRFREALCISLGGGNKTQSIDMPRFAINRTRDWAFGSLMEQAGCRVFNSAEAARTGNDKILSHLLAARLGLPQVGMAVCANDPAAIARHGLGYPVILKDPHGHGGSGVFLAHDEMELLARAGTIAGATVLLQHPCGRPGLDKRVYVLGGRVLAAVLRSSVSDFRANLSLGGAVELSEAGDEERAMVDRLTAALPLDYAGVDFIYDASGRPLFNEIEDAVGSRSLYMLGGPDTAELLLSYIASTLHR